MCTAQPQLIDISQTTAVWDEDGHLVLHVGLLLVALQPHTNLVHPPRSQVHAALPSGPGWELSMSPLLTTVWLMKTLLAVLVDEAFPTESC